jgi:hypothetical protein
MVENKRKLSAFEQKITEGTSRMTCAILNSPTLPVILGTLCTLYGYRISEVGYIGHQCVTECHSIVIRHPEFSTAVLYAGPDLSFVLPSYSLKLPLRIKLPELLNK